MDLLTSLTTLAAAGVPGDAPSARLAVPIGILVFFGSIYLLLRANLGTRRGYLVLATSFFGFMIIMSAFWTFGAPGTPQAVGPTYLPSQPSDAYQPTWTAFAGDSLVAERPDYQFVQDYPDGFGELPEDFTSRASSGADAIRAFFAESGNAPVSGFGEDWEAIEALYAEAPNGFPVIAVTYGPPPEDDAAAEGDEGAEDDAAAEGDEGAEDDAGAEGDEGAEDDAAAEDGAGAEDDASAEDEGAEDDAAAEDDDETVTLFGFFDEGAPLFPGLVFMGLSLLGFVLHAVLLNADEAREMRDLAELVPEEEKVPAGA